MIKNLLAAIGLFVVSQKGYELYREYSSLKREKEQGFMPSSETSFTAKE